MVNIDKGTRLCVIVLRLVEGKLLFCAPSKHKHLDGEGEVFLITIKKAFYCVAWNENMSIK